MRPLPRRFALRLIARVLTVSYLTLQVSIVRADEFSADPSIQARTAVDDNFLFSQKPGPSVLVLSLSPSLDLSETTENSKLVASASATAFHVGGQPADDHTDLNLAVAYTLKAERETVNATAGFVRDLTIDTELDQTGLLLIPVTRDDTSAALSWTHMLTERMSTTLAVSLDAARYFAPSGQAGISNYHYYAAPLSVAYQTTEHDTLSLTLAPSLYHADEIDNQSTSAQLQVTWQHQFLEQGTMSLSLGAFDSENHIKQTFAVCPLPSIYCQAGLVPVVELTRNQRDSETGSVVDVSSQYQLTETTGVNLHAARNLSPSGVGALVLVETVDGTLKHDFDETHAFSLAYMRTRSHVLGGIGAFANGIEAVDAHYLWRTSRNGRLEFGLRREQTTHDQPGPSVHADEVYASYRYDWPNSAAAQAAH